MFKLFTTEDGHQPPYVQLPCSAITPKIGMALYMTGGRLAVAGGASLAQYICMEDHASAVTAGDLVACVRIMPEQIWETGPDSTNTMTLGVAYDIASGGLLVDDNGTTNANFQTTYIGDGIVRGRFVK